MTSRLLTVYETARTLGVSTACIRKWISQRRITTVRLGRLVRIPDTEVTRLVSKGTVPAAQNSSRPNRVAHR
jgi:excisionase family DNA binding protein